ncbi:hypothetical protein V5799_003544 [Amblyomma americanum]|uniref:Uncharacterized protein n=1 Tax=Amblyomma americanum TaxID=6943 RepID=A0AAQ4D8N5_AMBAM
MSLVCADKDRRLSRIQRLRRRLSCSFGRLSLSKEVILPDGENEVSTHLLDSSLRRAAIRRRRCSFYFCNPFPLSSIQIAHSLCLNFLRRPPECVQRSAAAAAKVRAGRTKYVFVQ